jgi:hypothetical protein
MPAITREFKETDMSKKNEVVSQGAGNQVALSATTLDDWGQSEISSKDIVIPKILAMQGLSELVSEGKAKLGDFVDSISGEVLGSIEKPVEFVPFHMEKVWIISVKKKGESKFEFDRYEPVTPQNMDYPFEAQVGDDMVKYEYTLQFYVLLPHDTSMPYVLSFKSTSLRSGKVLSTQMYVRNRAAGLTPPSYTMLLGGKKEKNDKGTFIVMDTRVKGRTPAELETECLNWYKVIKAGGAKVAAEKPETHAEFTGNAQF